jgi:hypothetical protein
MALDASVNRPLSARPSTAALRASAQDDTRASAQDDTRASAQDDTRASAQDDTGSRRRAFAVLKAGLSAGAIAAPRTLPPDAVISTAIPALDRLLGGGFPRGALVTLEGKAGRWSIAARVVAQVTRRALAAIVDNGELYPPTLARAGARLDRVLIAPARTPLGIARTVDILLRTRACRLVLVLTAPDLRAAVWMRLARLAQRAGVLLVAIATRASAALAAATALRIDCALDRLLVHGTRGLWCTFGGYDLQVNVRKHHGFAAIGTHARVRAIDLPDGAVARERAVASQPVIQLRRERHAAVR